jgi:hypothetical protein
VAGDSGDLGCRRRARSAARLGDSKVSVATEKGERKSEVRGRGGDTQPSRLPKKFDGGSSVFRRAISSY